eukprot:2632040-Lingulodinium_polyedra.AAC.1
MLDSVASLCKSFAIAWAVSAGDAGTDSMLAMTEQVVDNNILVDLPCVVYYAHALRARLFTGGP